MTLYFFFFNDTATTEIYTLSLHDALPISSCAPKYTTPFHAFSRSVSLPPSPPRPGVIDGVSYETTSSCCRSEEHTSELQSRQYLVCRLLLEKKKKQPHSTTSQSHRHSTHR